MDNNRSEEGISLAHVGARELIPVVYGCRKSRRGRKTGVAIAGLVIRRIVRPLE
jgi:hypothetical protein